MSPSRRRIARTLAAVVLTCVAALAPPRAAGAAAGAAARAPEADEYELKAAYLLRFAQLVTWPRDAFGSGDGPLTIGVLGPDPFGRALERMVEGRRTHNRRITVKRLQWGQELRGIQILFLSSEDSHRIGELASRLAGLPILVVGDSADLARRGAAISFRIADERVRFDVNLEAARRARLTISSQMLRAAHIVKD